jgi:glycosyltransferase involved in cell wall biosynthesis
MSLKKPKITIGLPVYNAALFLHDCIHSILNQSFVNFELLIVNDGSKDESIDIIESFTDKRITLINDGLNKGLPKRLNEITQLAKGDFIVRMDADDIMHIDRLKTQLNILLENSFIDVLGSNAYSINEHNEIIGARMPLKTENNDLLKVLGFIHPTIIGKSIWFKNNLYDEKAIRCEDAELWNRVNTKSNFYCTSIPLLFYREFGGDYYKKYIGTLKGMFYVSKKRLREKKFKSFTLWVIKNNFLFLLKCLFYLFFHFIGKESVLMKMRNTILSSEKLGKGKQDLIESILSNNIKKNK